jgi:TetR/AcrR family transcriptional regulator
MVARLAEPTDVRSQVLAAATRLFARHGFEGTPLQLIADEVGVSKPAVLHHFPSKEDLRRAVLDAILDHWRDVLPRLLLAATASHDRFDAVFGELHRFFATDPDRARLVQREVLDRPDETRRLLRGPVKPWLGAIARYIEEGQKHGKHWPDIDPEAYVILVLQLVVSATAAASVCRGALDSESEAAARYDHELARIARASLFQPPPTTTKTATKAATTRRREQRR